MFWNIISVKMCLRNRCSVSNNNFKNRFHCDEFCQKFFLVRVRIFFSHMTKGLSQRPHTQIDTFFLINCFNRDVKKMSWRNLTRGKYSRITKVHFDWFHMFKSRLLTLINLNLYTWRPLKDCKKHLKTIKIFSNMKKCMGIEIFLKIQKFTLKWNMLTLITVLIFMIINYLMSTTFPLIICIIFNSSNTTIPLHVIMICNFTKSLLIICLLCTFNKRNISHQNRIFIFAKYSLWLEF